MKLLHPWFAVKLEKVKRDEDVMWNVVGKKFDKLIISKDFDPSFDSLTN